MLGVSSLSVLVGVGLTDREAWSSSELLEVGTLSEVETGSEVVEIRKVVGSGLSDRLT